MEVQVLSPAQKGRIYLRKNMITLGIETSCDETSICLLETRGEYPALEYRVLSHIIHSQIDIHSKYGGVFPMMAKREHAKRLVPLLEQALSESGLGSRSIETSKETLETVRKIYGEHDENLFQMIENSSLIKEKPVIDRIAVTVGPGLEPALWVGINFANALGTLWNIPVSGMNHMEGHIVVSLVPKTQSKNTFEKLTNCPFPAIAILLSGGHTEIVLVKEIGHYQILGATRDDAVGEAFDKVARMLGLPYPGGPEISKLAEEKRMSASSPHSAAKIDTVRFPRPMIDSPNLDMSFSGLKTAVLYELKKHSKITDDLQNEIACEFEDAVTETIIAKLQKAFEKNEAFALIAGGGVMANRHILSACATFAKNHKVPFFPPSTGLSGDNALMIALAKAITNEKTSGQMAGDPLRASGNLTL
ncbi:MAG: tRNA (adenosine(37)-N6)-threonylcarbamoyltransferase complex transferase subunit TsaD [Patescibacteria group bacterium]|nr:tRNA (adenosine(37)-N6)-threonylcarbamoyltransferase complex transferase subunit TsaD [Patescibacteria group bacterium]